MIDHGYSTQRGPSPERAAYVTERLRGFNLNHVADEPRSEPIEVYAVDDDGRVVGGLVGKAVWRWLEIGVLWVDETARQWGMGSLLLQEAEDEAQSRGCMFARLSTWEFQALDFYRKRGYVLYGQLDDYPLGHTVYYLRKRLSALEQ